MAPDSFEKRIAKIKEKLTTLGPMRPGSLSRQYNVCGVKGCRCKDPVSPQKHGPYLQLSYVHQGKSTTRFIRPHQADEVRQQLATYKRYKKLTETWVRLAIDQAERRLKSTRDPAS